MSALEPLGVPVVFAAIYLARSLCARLFDRPPTDRSHP